MKKGIYKIALIFGLYLSFAYYYLISVLGGGVYKLAGISSVYGGVAVGGAVGLIIFELAILLVSKYFKVSFKDYDGVRQEYFKNNIRLLGIVRNVILGSINFIFMVYPVASIWGLMTTYILFTSLMCYLWYVMYCRKFKLDGSKYLPKMSRAYLFYIIVYIILSGGVL